VFLDVVDEPLEEIPAPIELLVDRQIEEVGRLPAEPEKAMAPAAPGG
jgi:hypothetical protein